jgi:hypothetical protein
MHVQLEQIFSGLVELNNRGVEIRIVSEVTPENVIYCKKLMQFAP